MTGWLSWLVFAVAYPIVFVAWSWVPLQLLDRHWPANNAFGRPFLHSVVLVGAPAFYAYEVALPAAWVLIPITFAATQYAVLAGRVLRREMIVAGWVMVTAIVAIWVAFYRLPLRPIDLQAPHRLATSRTATPTCLGFADTVSVRGTLEREVHPGRPNYESIAQGDEAEAGFYLHLPDAICARPTLADSGDASRQSADSVLRVQLVLDSAGYAYLRSQVGSMVMLRGTLFTAFTGHHHAPLLLVVLPRAAAR